MNWTKENINDYWVGFLFGVFLISCSAVLFLVHDLEQTFVFMILVLGILFVIGSVLKPRISKTVPLNENHVDKPFTPDSTERLLVQYKENQENQRSLVRLLWEIPTIAIAISSAFLVASYGYFGTSNFTLLRAILLFFGSLLMFSVFLAVVKHRHFRGVWLEYSEKIESQLNLIHIPMWTDKTEETETWKRTDFFHKFFLPLRAERWLANILFLISIIFAFLSILNVYQYIIAI